jgi:hypothetical protein
MNELKIETVSTRSPLHSQIPTLANEEWLRRGRHFNQISTSVLTPSQRPISCRHRVKGDWAQCIGGPSPACDRKHNPTGDSLMSVVPSIIVLVITALLVFRYELTHLAAPASKPTPAPRRRPLRQSKASQQFGRGASRSAPSTRELCRPFRARATGSCQS